jgi:hypothetical protein
MPRGLCKRTRVGETGDDAWATMAQCRVAATVHFFQIDSSDFKLFQTVQTSTDSKRTFPNLEKLK